PGGQEGLHRPVVLSRPARAHRGARRLRAGLRDRARGRPPRAEPARDRRADPLGARPAEPDRGQRVAGAHGAPGRRPGRCLGQQRPARSPDSRGRRHRGRSERRLRHRRRPSAAPVPGPRGTGVVHARQLRPARALVQARDRDGRPGPVRHVHRRQALSNEPHGAVVSPLPIAVYNMISYEEINWGTLAAAATLITLPVLLVALVAQRHIVTGLTFGLVLNHAVLGALAPPSKTATATSPFGLIAKPSGASPTTTRSITRGGFCSRSMMLTVSTWPSGAPEAPLSALMPILPLGVTSML